MSSRSVLLSNRLTFLAIGQTNRSHFNVCKLREHDQVRETYQPHFWPQIPRLVPSLTRSFQATLPSSFISLSSIMQVNPHYELYRVQRAQVNEVCMSAYLRGQFDQIYPGLP